jgi:hypothetical protein
MTMGEGDGYQVERHNPFANVTGGNAIAAWYRTRGKGKRLGKNMSYWERKKTSFNNQSIMNLYKSPGSGWSADDWQNQVKSIMSGETNVQWRDGVKYQQRSKEGWGSMWWQPAKGFETSYKTSVGDDGIVHREAVENKGFADYGAGWSRAGRAKKNYKAAKKYGQRVKTADEEYNKTFTPPAPPPESGADAPSTSQGSADKTSSAGPRKTTDMTIASKKKKRKELGAPGGGGGGGGGSLGVSY